MESKQAGPERISPSNCAGRGCGGGDTLDRLPAAIRERVHNHPCFSADAHHHYARMHVAVAPACNIQCHYCNRKYDCANESRPGVVSELLEPQQAAAKVAAVAAHIPQLAVVGIAGPGDPLANPERTFATFRLIAERTPDLRLCVSTNGLALPETVDTLCRYNIEHVTVTINCLDPDIGAEIYPWVFWNNRRVRGRKGAEILIEQQQLGLERLVERGMLVKVNSVLIPGVNDQHLTEVSRAVKAKGAFLHNLMPLIAAPEHGTFYGLMGQRAPRASELRALQTACAGEMAIMRHCKQCRADAVGMLGDDRSAEFTRERIATLEIDDDAALARRAATREAIERRRQAATPALVPVATLSPPRPTTRAARIAVASSDGRRVDQHFGQAERFLVYEVDEQGERLLDDRPLARYCNGAEHCDEDDDALAPALAALADCAMVLCARIGLTPWEGLEAAGIRPNGELAMSPIEQALHAAHRELADLGALSVDEPQCATLSA
ncbi:nitrogenase cofactor biosynthesis protein NifB [Marichromatium bheemlicum]|uniref:FeMo cofactor biosynthesis protein NifB n=1 Tax=Marichromatium bheemlicum TaxID=365339 RepID=A0ABX1I5R8_9GAMM|nr:nitrogenase cofactor biosynthesis protein NifB [Marichromatium bheemlicum]NKN32613.1 nitrogenase cofactor biosynthesis protein NifB [Marichromatium bheemlicum]